MVSITIRYGFACKVSEAKVKENMNTSREKNSLQNPLLLVSHFINYIPKPDL